MKKLLTILLITVSTKGLAQKANAFINARIKGLKAGEWVYCRNPQNGQRDSVLPKPDGFQFELYIPDGEGDIYLLQSGKDGKQVIAFFYLEKGTVNITATA